MTTPYAALIHRNKQRLRAAAEVEGTALHAFMSRGATWRYYERLIDAIAEHAPHAVSDEDGKKYVCVSIRYICRGGGIPKTASANITMFTLFGLIEKISSNEYLHSDTFAPAFMAEGYRRNYTPAKERGISWYHIPEYTPVLLERAELYAQMWQESGHPLKAINKPVLIRLYGAENADRAYGYNGVNISMQTREAERRLKAEAERLIGMQGYFYPWQMFASCRSEDFNEVMLERIWAGILHPLLTEKGWKYGRPSKALKGNFKLDSDKWIISTA